MSNQDGRRQAWAELAGIPNEFTYDDTFRQFAFGAGFAGTTFNELMVDYLRSITGIASYNLPDLEKGLAVAMGVGSWNEVGYDQIIDSYGDKHFWFQRENGSVMPAWTPSTPDWRVECYIYRQTQSTEAGGFEFIVSNAANSAQNGLIVDTAAEAFKFRSNYGAGLTIIVDQADGGSVIDTEYLVQGQFKALDNWLDVDSARAASNTTLTPIPVAYDVLGGDTNTTMIGSIWGLKLIDTAAPANSRYYPMNEGSGGFFRCYEIDEVTPKPSGDIAIDSFTEAQWKVTPYVQATVLIGIPTGGNVGVAVPVTFSVARNTYAPDPSTYLWAIKNTIPRGLTGTFSDPTAASPTFTADSGGTYVLGCSGLDMGGNALTPATVVFDSEAVSTIYFYSDGVSDGNVMPAWTPTGVNYRQTLWCDVLDDIPPTAAKTAVSGEGTSPGMYFNTTPDWIFRGKKASDGTDSSLTITVPDVTNGVHEMIFDVISTGMLGFIDGTPTPASGIHNVITGGMMIPGPLTRTQGNASNTFKGAIWGLYLEDRDDPGNNRYYPMNEGYGATVFKCYSAPDMLTALPAFDIPITVVGEWSDGPPTNTRFVFDGPLAGETGQDIPDWMPSDVPYAVEYKIYFEETIPPTSAKLELSPNSGNLPSNTISTAGNQVTRATLSSGSEQVLTCGPVAQFKQFTVRQEVSPTGQRTWVNGTPTPASQEQAGTMIVSVNPFSRIMGNSATGAINGSMRALWLEDVNDPSNNRYYPMDEGSGTVFKCYSDKTMATPLPAYDITITASGQWVVGP